VLGVDYHDTFAPTARITSVRALMQIAVQHDLVVHQLDVKLLIEMHLLTAKYLLINLKVLK